MVLLDKDQALYAFPEILFAEEAMEGKVFFLSEEQGVAFC
jgi:hypothetical protein